MTSSGGLRDKSACPKYLNELVGLTWPPAIVPSFVCGA